MIGIKNNYGSSLQYATRTPARIRPCERPPRAGRNLATDLSRASLPRLPLTFHNLLLNLFIDN